MKTMITDHGISILMNSEDGTSIVSFPIEYKESFPYVYPLATSIGWDVYKIVDALEMYHKIGIDDEIAGTSLRRVLSVLNDVSTNLLCVKSDILAAYGTLLIEVSHRDHDLGEILDIFNKYQVKSRDIFYIFGFPAGIDYIDLMYARKMGKI
jgi:hypothetical protein